MGNKLMVVREWLRCTNNSFGHDVSIKEGYGKIFSQLKNEKLWLVSDYNEPNHPFYKLITNTEKKYKIVSSFYFNTDDLKLLSAYFEKDLEIKMQRLIDNPPIVEPDSAFYGETFAVETVTYKDKTLTLDVMINKDFREVWGLSKVLESIQKEINLNGGIYLIYAEYIEDKKEI